MKALQTPGKLWRTMTAADRILCGAILSASLIGMLFARTPSKGSSAAIFVAREERMHLPLDEDRRVEIRGALGPLALQVRAGSIAVVQSECPNRLCVEMGWKRSAGGVIACVPNQVLVRIEGGPSNGSLPDGVSR
jgi:hypothetical protein